MTEESEKKKAPGLLDRIGLQRENRQLRRDYSACLQTCAKLELRLEQLTALHEIGRSLATILDPNEVLIRIVEAAVSITKAEDGTLMLLDEHTDELYMRAQKGLSEEFAQTLRLKVSDSLAGQVLTTGKLIIRQNQKVVTGYIAKAIIYVPVIYKSKTLGVLSVDNQKAEVAFSEDDEHLLCGLADYAAIAIKNTSLVENLQSRNQILTSLHRTGHSILSALTLDKVLSQIVESAFEVLKADVIVLYQYDKKEDTIIVPPTFRGMLQAPEVLEEEGPRHEQSVVFKMVRRGQSFYAPDAQADWAGENLTGVSYMRGEASFIVREGIVSSAGIILTADNEIVGVMFVNYRVAHTFADEEKEVFEIFANQAALAIQHARLFNQQQKQMEQEKTLREQAETLRRSLEAISSPLKLEEVSEKILDGVRQIVEYRKASLQLVRGDVRTLLAGRGFDVKTANPLFHREISKDRLMSRVVTSQAPLILSQAVKDPDWITYSATADVRSWVGVSLVYAQEVIGLLTLDHDQPGFYTPAIKDLLASFAHQAAIDLRKAYLFDTAEERIKHLEIINNVIQIMTTKLDTRDLLEAIVSQIAEQLECRHCTIFFPQEKDGELVLVPQVTNGENSEQIMSRRFKPDEGLAGWVFQHGASIALDDAVQDPRFAPARREREGPCSMLVVPIKSGDQTIGVISADQDATGWFKASNQRLVEALALQAGIAIERNVGLELLQDISNRIASLQDVDLILSEIVRGAIKLTHTTTGVIYLTSDDGQSVIKSFYPPSFKHPMPRLDLAEGITRQVIATGEVVHILDVRNDSRVHPTLREHFQSMIAVPLKLAEKVIGVLYLDDKDSHDFTETEVSMLSTLASQAAIAIEKASLLEERKQRLGELTALHDTSLDIVRQSDLEQILRDVIRKAVELQGAQSGGVLLTYSSEREVRMAFTLNLDAMRDFICKFSEGMAGQVAESGQPLIVDDYQTWPHRIPNLGEEPYRHLLKAVAQVPLNWKNEIIGVLFVSDSRRDKTFSQRDTRLLERFANLAALAIGNAREHFYMQGLVAVSPDAIIAADRKGYIAQFNEASERILGFPKEEVIGQHVAQYYWDGEKEARKINHMLVEAGKAGLKNYETYVKGKDGKKIPIRLAGMVLQDETGRRLGSFGVMTDLRERTSLLKSQRESDFLVKLEFYPKDVLINSLTDLQERITKQLEMTREFYQVDYMILFASAREDETVLQAIAWTHLPPEVNTGLPHFNWRKAGFLPSIEDRVEALRLEADLITKWRPNDEWRQKVLSGIRGNNAEFFASASCGVPLRLADNYRGMLVFGPFDNTYDLADMADFIRNVAQTISISSLGWLQTLNLRTRNRESELSTKLLIHRARMSLTQIMGKLGSIKSSSDIGESRQTAEDGEKLVANLARVIGRVLTSRFAEMEPRDFTFQSYPLSTFVQNCVESFREKAKSMRRELVLDPSIEYLPDAETDPTTLFVALSNLIENALKYSFEGTLIRVFSAYDTRQVTIIVEDVGEQMSEKARDNLIRPGKRWAMSARARRIPGTGLGLWDASVIVAAHGGTLDFAGVYHKQVRGKPAHLVRVWMTLPFKQS